MTWAEETQAGAAADEYSLKPPLSPVHSSQREEGDAMDADDASAPVPMDDDEEEEDDEPPSPAAAAAIAKKTGILKETTVRAPAPAAGVTASGAAVATASTLDGAADGWAAVCDDAAGEDVAVDAAPAHLADGSLPLDSDSTLPFFFLDAHEDIAHPGTVFLFGRVPVDASKVEGAVSYTHLTLPTTSRV